MAFDPERLALVVQPVGPDGVRIFSYKTDEASDALTGAGYLAGAANRGVRPYDLILVAPETTGSPYLLTIDSVTDAGDATASLGDDLENLAVKHSAQTLTTSQQDQARRNIGAGFGATIPAGTTAAAIQAAIDAAANKDIKIVAMQGTYTAEAPIHLRPGVTLWCMPGAATIQRPAASATTGRLIRWGTYLAHGAGLDGVIVDGNRDANSDSTDDALLNCVGGVTDPFVKNCRVINSTGHGMLFTDSLRPVVVNNVVDNCSISGIYIYGVTVTESVDALVSQNRLTQYGRHAIVTWNTQGSRIIDNTCVGSAISATVDINGAVVTWASGTDFADVKPGEFVIGIHSGGHFEGLIVSNDSDTQLTLSASVGTYTNVPVVVGNGDVISISGSRDELIQGNMVDGGASLGISLFATANSSVDRCKVYGNTVIDTMASGYALSIAAGGNFARDNAFIGNIAVDTGQGDAATHASFRSGMTAQTGSSGSGNIVDDNQFISTGSAMAEGLRVSTGSSVRVGKNKVKGLASEAIVDGATVTLSAGWSGATVSELEVYGDAISFLVTTTAVAPAANPSITIAHNCLPIRKKQPAMQMTATSSVILPCITFYPDAASASVFIVNGTPGPSKTYRFVARF